MCTCMFGRRKKKENKLAENEYNSKIYQVQILFVWLEDGEEKMQIFNGQVEENLLFLCTTKEPFGLGNQPFNM